VFRATGDGASGTVVELACFVAGTRIATAHGEVPVELLAPGDPVRTHSGALRPVRWIGHRRLDCRRHPRPETVRPLRVSADAFAPGRPRRALLLSPDHAVFVDGVLIPARHLVNGVTIAPVAAESVTYFHVELDRHDIILAEGLPTESFLDTGNRAAFGNGGAVTRLHPDFAQRVWDADACAPLIVDGPLLARVRRRLLARAAYFGETGMATSLRRSGGRVQGGS
jgi:hypothetical protein